MLGQLPYLNLNEAAEYCNCTVSQLLRIAEKGPEYVELLYTVTYEDMGFGSDQVPLGSGDTGHFLAIPCTNVKDLIHSGQTSVQTFLVSKTAGWTVIMLDILQRLSVSSGTESVKEIRCKSERVVKQEDLYVMRESVNRFCSNNEKSPLEKNTYLTLKEAAGLYGKSINQILMEGTKGAEHLELLYWVSYKDVHHKNEYRQFEGIRVAGDYLVLPKERVVELRHQGHTATGVFYYPIRSHMHEGMEQIRKEKRLYSGDSWKRGQEFIRCETEIIIFPEDDNLVVTTADLDRIWSRHVQGRICENQLLSERKPEEVGVTDDSKYPTELQVAIMAEREFSTGEGARTPRATISRFIEKRLQEKDVEPIDQHTCNRIAELITCNEMDIVAKAWEAVYGQKAKASRTDMERYLKEELGFNPNSNNFRRIAAATTPDNQKRFNARYKK